MRIRLAGRYDALLIAGFAVAALFLFGSGIQYLLDVAREVERRQGVALLPALVVLSVAFLFQQNMKRQSANAQAMAHAAEAAQAQARMRELEALVACGRSLARALTADALRETLWRHLPQLFGTRDVSVWSNDGASWQELVGGGCLCRESIVRAAAAHGSAPGDNAPGLVEDDRCLHLPLVVGVRLVGWIAASKQAGDWAPDDRKLLEAIAAPIGIAIRNAQMFHDLEKTAINDTLTGCFTKAYGLELMDVELRRANRSHAPLSVLMFDVDKFKTINDRHGHLAGDAVLAAVGRRLANLLRRSDIRCRYGGDEFVIVLPETPPEGAALVAGNLAREIEQLVIPAGAESVRATISVGLAHALVGELDATALIARADEALYRAKAGGRNCVRGTPFTLHDGGAARAS